MGSVAEIRNATPLFPQHPAVEPTRETRNSGAQSEIPLCFCITEGGSRVWEAETAGRKLKSEGPGRLRSFADARPATEDGMANRKWQKRIVQLHKKFVQSAETLKDSITEYTEKPATSLLSFSASSVYSAVIWPPRRMPAPALESW